MKRFLTILTVLMFAFASATSQQLNWQGLKMVKSIEIERYLYGTGAARSTIYAKSIASIKFDYDSKTYLTCMDAIFSFENFERRKKTVGRRETYTLRDGKLMRKDIDSEGRVDKNKFWEYRLDNGIITKIEEYCKSSDGSNECLRRDNNITYTTDENGYPTINGVVYEWYVRMRGTNFFQKGDGADSRRITSFRYLNGDLDYHTKSNTLGRRVNWEDTPFDKYLSYNGVNNDTNINWIALVFSYDLGGNYDKADERLLTLTEWLPCRSKHLLTRCTRWGQQDIAYTFENNNIVRIDLTINGKLQRTVRIEYLTYSHD